MILQSKPFIVLQEWVKNEKQDQLPAGAYPAPHPSHAICGHRSVKGGVDAHTIGGSANEMQPLCLSYCTQMVNTTLAPPAKTIMGCIDESSKLLMVEGEQAEKREASEKWL